MNESQIQFAVVGHPNKGKSSIVSTLAHNDSIQISRHSGTTKQASAYSVNNDEAGFELIDTPGFQRPRQALKWLQAHGQSADQRAEAVRLFVNNKECQSNFPDEVKLLNPIVNGAAILYVVDGSRPYGAEYEAEMEILRWTGRASMALINPIENDTHVNTWKSALEQYFKIVRVFDPMQADFDKQIALLEAFAHLQPQWSIRLTQVISDLRQQQVRLVEHCATLLAHLLEDVCCYQYRQKALNESQARALETVVNKAYREWMRNREAETFEKMKSAYAHHYSKIEIDAMAYPPNLFDLDHWYAFGLNKRQLLTVSATAGALSGAAIDIALAGHSFMLGSIGGGLLGFGGALVGGEKLTRLRIKGLPLGGFEACQGPIRDKNFPYVVLGRFLYLFTQLKHRNHAKRDQVTVKNLDLHTQLDNLTAADKKALTIALDKLSRQKPVESLAKKLLPLLNSQGSHCN